MIERKSIQIAADFVVSRQQNSRFVYSYLLVVIPLSLFLILALVWSVPMPRMGAFLASGVLGFGGVLALSKIRQLMQQAKALPEISSQEVLIFSNAGLQGPIGILDDHERDALQKEGLTAFHYPWATVVEVRYIPGTSQTAVFTLADDGPRGRRQIHIYRRALQTDDATLVQALEQYAPKGTTPWGTASYQKKNGEHAGILVLMCFPVIGIAIWGSFFAIIDPVPLEWTVLGMLLIALYAWGCLACLPRQTWQAFRQDLWMARGRSQNKIFINAITIVLLSLACGFGGFKAATGGIALANAKLPHPAVSMIELQASVSRKYTRSHKGTHTRYLCLTVFGQPREVCFTVADANYASVQTRASVAVRLATGAFGLRWITHYRLSGHDWKRT